MLIPHEEQVETFLECLIKVYETLCGPLFAEKYLSFGQFNIR